MIRVFGLSDFKVQGFSAVLGFRWLGLGAFGFRGRRRLKPETLAMEKQQKRSKTLSPINSDRNLFSVSNPKPSTRNPKPSTTNSHELKLMINTSLMLGYIAARNTERIRASSAGCAVLNTADDLNPWHYLKDPKLWELWYIPYYGKCRIHIINRMSWIQSLNPVIVGSG